MREVWDERNYKFQRTDRYPEVVKSDRGLMWALIGALACVVVVVCLSY
jgi:hypothetical protein